jgi:hypothetical protein
MKSVNLAVVPSHSQSFLRVLENTTPNQDKSPQGLASRSCGGHQEPQNFLLLFLLLSLLLFFVVCLCLTATTPSAILLLMAQGLVSQWWDRILDGGIYRVDVESSGYNTLGTLRAAVYREAENRHRLVATHKASVDALLIQAWGIPGLDENQPRLKGQRALPLSPLSWRLGRAEPPPPGPSPMPADGGNEPSLDDELLGPCTCGQAPACLPDCARVTGAAA